MNDPTHYARAESLDVTDEDRVVVVLDRSGSGTRTHCGVHAVVVGKDSADLDRLPGDTRRVGAIFVGSVAIIHAVNTARRRHAVLLAVDSSSEIEEPGEQGARTRAQSSSCQDVHPRPTTQADTTSGTTCGAVMLSVMAADAVAGRVVALMCAFACFFDGSDVSVGWVLIRRRKAELGLSAIGAVRPTASSRHVRIRARNFFETRSEGSRG